MFDSPNVEASIRHLRAMLREPGLDALSPESAEIHERLATELLRRDSYRETFMEAAICLLKARKAYAKHGQGAAEAAALERMGDLFLDRSDEHRVEDVENARAFLQFSLQCTDDKASPERAIHRLLRLAIAFKERGRGDKLENLKWSEFHLKRADAVFRERFGEPEAARRVPYPVRELLAGIEIDLAGVWAQQPRRNIRREIEYVERGLSRIIEDGSPEKVALTGSNLTMLYWQLAQTGTDTNSAIEAAIKHGEAALGQSPITHGTRASLHMNLGIAYGARLRGDRRESLETALGHLEEALAAPTTLGAMRGAVLQNLGACHGDRSREFGLDELPAAIIAWEEALAIRTRLGLLDEACQSALSLGKLHYGRGEYARARAKLTQAHEFLVQSKGEATRVESRQWLGDTTSETYEMLTHCCLLEGETEIAYHFAVHGKGQVTSHLLGMERPSLARVSESSTAGNRWVTGLRDRWQALDELQHRYFWAEADTKTRLSDEVGAMRQALEAYWREFVFEHYRLDQTRWVDRLGGFSPALFGALLDADLVDYYRHAGGWGAFVSSGGVVQYVALPGAKDWSYLEPLAQEPWTRASSRDNDFCPMRVREVDLAASLQILRRLYDDLVRPLEGALPIEAIPHSIFTRTRRRLIMAPSEETHSVPLQAALMSEGPAWAKARDPLLVPSMGALQVLAMRQRKKVYARGSSATLLSVAYAGPDTYHTDYLAHAEAEARAVAERIPGSRHLIGLDASPSSVIAAARDATYLHFACHGWFDTTYASQCGLVLAGGVLSVQRISSEMELDRVRLVTLAACHSGRHAVTHGNELTGVVLALLTAGAGVVVSTLWAVSDEVAEAYFTTLYDSLALGATVPRAMADATAKVRSRPSWEDPYYWAGFTLHGLPDVA